MVLSQGSQENFLSNEFWKYFASGFRFYWPYEQTAIFEKDKWTGSFRFSGCFQNYLHEIRMWRMDLDFFNKYPMLLDDMCPQESIPPLVGSSLAPDFSLKQLKTPTPENEHEVDEMGNLVTLGLTWPLGYTVPDPSRLIEFM
jgi:hypothetical protein